MLPPRHDSSRSEMLALCIVLELHLDASYERPVPQRRVRTPDWLLSLPDGRDVALEVTTKMTAWTYEDWDEDDGTTILVGSRTKDWTTGDTEDLRKTLYRKMKDKAERGQLQGVLAERWLAIQLDDDAGSELESLFEPVPRITIDVATRKAVDAYSLAVMPDFCDIIEQARVFGYDEVWAFTQAVRADGRTMVLRLVASQHRWECFHMLAKSWFEGGGIARQLESVS